MSKLKEITKIVVKRMDSRIQRFHNGKSGMELLQLAIVILIAIGLIAAVGLLASNVNTKISQSATAVGNLSSDFSGWSNYTVGDQE